MGVVITTLATQLHKKTVCMVFGQGLIGCHISRQLSLYSSTPVKSISLKWTDSAPLLSAVSHLQNCEKSDHLEIIWSAGRGGFSSTTAEMKQEFDIFKKVIQQLNYNRKGTLVVSLISSAGGLYEGQRFIDEGSSVSPQRPYAVVKLKQEQLLARLDIPHRIYRVASAYGVAPEHSRIGLVNALLINSKIGRTTRIFASPDTLRDFILNTDIARLVVGDIRFSKSRSTQIVCTGRSITIYALINMIKQIMNVKAKVIYLSTNNNDGDMIFSNMIVPSNFAISTLEEGIRLVAASPTCDSF